MSSGSPQQTPGLGGGPHSLAGEATGPAGVLPKIHPDQVLPSRPRKTGNALWGQAPEQRLIVPGKRRGHVAGVRGRLRGQREVAGGTVGRAPCRKLQGGNDSLSLHKVVIGKRVIGFSAERGRVLSRVSPPSRLQGARWPLQSSGRGLGQEALTAQLVPATSALGLPFLICPRSVTSVI